jgi:hypothetical protein
MSTPASSLAGADAAAQQQRNTTTVVPCPYRFVLEVLVLDSEDTPAIAIPVEVRQSPSEAIRTKTDSNGIARFEGLLEKSYGFSLYSLAPDGWTVTDTPELEAPNSSHGPAAWGAIPAAANPDSEYEIKEGECVTKIGARFGVLPQAIWDRNSSIHSSRPSMNLLVPGDRLTIPGFQPKSEQGLSGRRYVVTQSAPQAMLRVQFQDADGEPRTELKYLVEFQSDQPVESLEGITDSDGFVVETIPPDASKATITLSGIDGPEEHQMRISHLEPVSTTRGLQARLHNLGCGSGDEDGEIGPLTAAALSLFQSANGLKATGKPDKATQDKLAGLHHS